jgi:hypothetical protein
LYGGQKFSGIRPLGRGHRKSPMVGSPFGKKYIKRDGMRLLRRKLPDGATVNMSRPIQTIPISQQAFADLRDGVIADVCEGEVGGDGVIEFKRLPGAEVIRDQLGALEDIDLNKPQNADQNDHAHCDQDGSGLDALELH